jgi:hypothetical protein
VFELVRAGLGHRQPWRNLGTCQPRRTMHFRERQQPCPQSLCSRSSKLSMQLFDKFKVTDGHPMSKWALCKECCITGNYALAQVSRGSHDPGKRCVSNLRKHVQIHHKSTYENLLLREGTSAKITDHLARSTKVTRGAPNQSEEETVDVLLQLVTEELDPWSSTQSFTD